MPDDLIGMWKTNSRSSEKKILHLFYRGGVSEGQEEGSAITLLHGKAAELAVLFFSEGLGLSQTTAGQRHLPNADRPTGQWTGREERRDGVMCVAFHICIASVSHDGETYTEV